MKIPLTPPNEEQLLADPKVGGPAMDCFLRGDIGPTTDGKYRHWDTLRHITPPHGLSSESWWLAIKTARTQTRRTIPLLDTRQRQFSYTMPDPMLEMLHEIDQHAAGRIAMPDSIVNPHTRDKYLQSSLTEEAITSSQLEGAATTREQAKDMLRANRKPIDHHERMILNNYNAMQLVGEVKRRKMTRALVMEIHRTIAAVGTQSGVDAPRLRVADDDIVVGNAHNNIVVHRPPPADQLPARMKALCQFANRKSESEGFMHPVVRAILLHFWLAYDHPFTDGNGRVARALFYWSMLGQDYWLAEFISISHILRKAPSKYARAFLYAETDGNDLTYFVLAQLKVIRRAIVELRHYVKRKTGEARAVEQLLRASSGLNHRQVALVSHALRNPGFRYTIASHGRSHAVVYQTARSDLLSLSEKGLLLQSRPGRALLFTAPPDLIGKLRD